MSQKLSEKCIENIKNFAKEHCYNDTCISFAIVYILELLESKKAEERIKLVKLLESNHSQTLKNIFNYTDKDIKNATESVKQPDQNKPSIEIKNENNTSSHSNPVQTNTQSQNLNFYGLPRWLMWTAIGSVTILSVFKIFFIIIFLIYKKCEWELIGLTKESCEFIANLL